MRKQMGGPMMSRAAWSVTMPYPELAPFVVPPERELVTHERPQAGDEWRPGHNDREWIGFQNQGGGYVPESHTWTSNPKQVQDDFGAK